MRAKQTEIGDSGWGVGVGGCNMYIYIWGTFDPLGGRGVTCIYIWGTFDPLVFKVIWGSFDEFLSKYVLQIEKSWL